MYSRRRKRKKDIKRGKDKGKEQRQIERLREMRRARYKEGEKDRVRKIKGETGGGFER